jgi:hypothetical protein
MRLTGLKLLDGIFGGRAHNSPGCSWIVLLIASVTVISFGYREGYPSLIAIGALMLIALLWMGFKAFVTRD